uniref:SREBP regulating gene protein n=1 Tax=Ciona savignyi TaxID=51511 RepID=H2Y9V0_CIOSA
IARNIRKRWFLAALFITSLVYFVYKTNFRRESVRKDTSFKLVQNAQRVEVFLRTLKWQPRGNPWNSSSYNPLKQCRNSLQGKDWIVDDNGCVCKRDSLRDNGCCDVTAPATKWQTCASCRATNCCVVYEHCVSCCLQPKHRALLEKAVRETRTNTILIMMSSIHDQYELCLMKCRTSSLSVRHENTYRDPTYKYCFGSVAS